MVTSMLNLKMDIYTAATGVQKTLAWANPEEYRLGKKFLMEVGALCCSQTGEQPEFFHLQTVDQLESLYAFRRTLRERANGTVADEQ